MLTIAALTADKSLLRMAGELTRVGRRTTDTLFKGSFKGHFLVTANVHGRPPHLTAQIFNDAGTFTGGVHFNLEDDSIPKYRAFKPNKRLAFQRTAKKWAGKNFFDLKNYTILDQSD